VLVVLLNCFSNQYQQTDPQLVERLIVFVHRLLQHQSGLCLESASSVLKKRDLSCNSKQFSDLLEIVVCHKHNVAILRYALSILCEMLATRDKQINLLTVTKQHPDLWITLLKTYEGDKDIIAYALQLVEVSLDLFIDTFTAFPGCTIMFEQLITWSSTSVDIDANLMGAISRVLCKLSMCSHKLIMKLERPVDCFIRMIRAFDRTVSQQNQEVCANFFHIVKLMLLDLQEKDILSDCRDVVTDLVRSIQHWLATMTMLDTERVLDVCNVMDHMAVFIDDMHALELYTALVQLIRGQYKQSCIMTAVSDTMHNIAMQHQMTEHFLQHMDCISDLMECLQYHKHNTAVVTSITRLLYLLTPHRGLTVCISSIPNQIALMLDALRRHLKSDAVVSNICGVVCGLIEYFKIGAESMTFQNEFAVLRDDTADLLELLTKAYSENPTVFKSIQSLQESWTSLFDNESKSHQSSSITTNSSVSQFLLPKPVEAHILITKEDVATLTAPKLISSADIEVTAPIDMDMFKGRWKCTLVILKLAPLSSGNAATDRNAKKAWLQEYENLNTLRHPRIVSLLGCCVDISTTNSDAVLSKDATLSSSALILEYMANGNLRTLLNVEHASLTVLERVQIAVDVSEGMRFLHECNLFHRDLKSIYVLLDDNKRAKLTGFGPGVSGWSDSASTIEDITPNSVKAESKEDQQLRMHADITAFGAILWELVTGKSTWSTSAARGKQKQKQGHHHKLKLTEQECKQYPAGFATIWSKCMASSNFAEKANVGVIFPNFAEIHAALRTVLEDETKRMREREKLVPDGFLCPITQDVMKDPVMLIDGHSYERKSIMDWLKRHKRSPLTNEELPMQSDGSGMPLILDNYALKSSIESLLTSKPM
jgi:serine/threonine protein kinase